MRPVERRAALYVRVSTHDQAPQNQLAALRTFGAARGWAVTEFVDHGVSGAKGKRPQLDAMLADVRRRKFDLVVVTKLDRLARSTRHLVTVAAELEALGVDLVVLDQAIDTTTPSGRLLFHVLAAIAEFERDLIRDRVRAGMRRAQEHGTRSGRRIGRPARQVRAVDVLERRSAGQSWRQIARALKVPAATLRRVSKAGQKPGAELQRATPSLAPVSNNAVGCATT